MNIHLSQHNGIPVYLQIANQIKQLISSKRLLAKQELLPIRILAEQLLINPNTVAKAYRELEAEGWIYKKRGAGTFVSDQTSALSKAACQKQITEQIRALLAEAEHMNISIDEIISAIQTISKKHSEEQ